MKYISFTVCFSLILFSACAPGGKIIKQNYPSPFEFSITESSADKKDELFVRAFEWVSKSYGSAKAVVDMHDKEAGKIIGKAMMSFPKNPFGNIAYVMSIDVRDGKYRMVLSDFRHSGRELTSAYGPSTGTEYGDLNQQVFMRRFAGDAKKTEDKVFYSVKNYAMTEAQAILTTFSEKMKTKDSF
ncbi:DUF4468 domain-containing protein [Chitinophaga rhizosphaerae]|uniref:DUF4468 domain-containing protein n=1 Tax=Chitinophaga rhizosphaerae TaxID=1864947 RepID=UPI000F813059|nr:DUF4468 domain-containing protein [Chitinophaga rhizosphaerae]